MQQHEFWHVRHACGHAVWWNHMTLAFMISEHYCPWCGGETMIGFVPDDHVFVDRERGIMAWRDFDVNGSVPCVPGMLETDEPVILHHRVDESCCRG